MASVASQLIEEVTAHAQSGSLEDAREIWADGTYFPNNLRIYTHTHTHTYIYIYIFKIKMPLIFHGNCIERLMQVSSL